MEALLKILMVEDLSSDAELIKYQIRKNGIQFIDQVVDNEVDYVNAIHDFKPDIILSDYYLPCFNGMQALLIREELVPEIPFILVTGSINEETAIEVIKAGADDYIIKDHDIRLPTAIRKAIEKKEILRQNKASEDLLKILSLAVEQNPASIVITNIKGDIEYVNTKFSRLTGYSFEEVIGKNPRVLKSGSKSSDEYKNLWETICSGGEWQGEFENVKKNGEIYFESAVISPISNDSGIITHFLAVKEDVTEKKKIDKKIKLLAHSLESITECVSITDTNDQVIYVNESFLRTYGYTEDELIGKQIDMVRPPEMKGIQVRNILPKTIEGGWRGEIMNRKKDGTFFPILLSSSVIKDEKGKMIALIGVASDITEMIRSREELLKATAKAEESNLLRSALLNNLSHEIRTPMNAIMGFAGLMSEANEEEKNSFASIILKSSGQLLSLIDEVILLSRLQSEKMTIDFSRVSPAETVRDIFSIFSLQELKQGVNLNMIFPEQYRNLDILSDSNKVRQILTNLVSNAIKYTNQGTIEIGFDLCNEHVEFYVKDTGIGIPEIEQKRIFETFYRGEQAIISAIGGTGLGLSISKELVGLLGGSIGVSSEPNKGSRFYFTIPNRKFEKELDPFLAQEGKPREIKDFVILIVDDEPVNIQYLNILLKYRVKRVDHAFNGKEAIEMAIKHHYNLILMDIKMPVMGGIEATKILKSKFPGLRIVAQTAFTLAEDAACVLEAGCDDILSKPVRKEALLEMLHKYGRSRANG